MLLEDLQNWYDVKGIEKVDSPSLLVYPRRVKQNIKRAITMAGGPEFLQPHVKTFKCQEVVGLLMNEGVTKFKCSTIAEAEMLAIAGAKEVLIAYPMVGPKVDRMVKLILAYQDTQFSCLVDCPAQAEHLSDHTHLAEVYLRVYLDLNVGTDRTGIRPGKKAEGLFDLCKATSHLIIMGLHVYDGHLRQIDIKDRRLACNEAFEPVQEMACKMEKKYGKKVSIIAGGSPTFPIHSKREGVICSPGTFPYWDRGYALSLPEQKFAYAAVLICRVISKPAPDLICVDLGYKSVASEGPLENRVWFLDYPDLVPVSHSEEHLVLRIKEDMNLTVGKLLYAIPYHICPTVAMYDRVLPIEYEKVTGRWATLARRRRINI